MLALKHLYVASCPLKIPQRRPLCELTARMWRHPVLALLAHKLETRHHLSFSASACNGIWWQHYCSPHHVPTLIRCACPWNSAPRATPSPRGGGGGGGGATRGGNTYNSYTTVAPPVYGGYGGGWGGGISLFPRFYSPPIFGFGLPIGGFFNFLVGDEAF